MNFHRYYPILLITVILYSGFLKLKPTFFHYGWYLIPVILIYKDVNITHVSHIRAWIQLFHVPALKRNIANPLRSHHIHHITKLKLLSETHAKCDLRRLFESLHHAVIRSSLFGQLHYSIIYRRGYTMTFGKLIQLIPVKIIRYITRHCTVKC